MRRVQLQDPFAFRNLLVHRLEQPFQVRRKRVPLRNQAARTVGQPHRKAHFAHLVAQRRFQEFHQLFEFLLRLFDHLLRSIHLEVALRHRLEVLLPVLEHLLHDPFIDRIGHEQHVVTLRTEIFQCG
ncbi:hypothetical protein SDC9_152633 [bioreactor metagenome]|uniref:Uncharacterized protein n=1 Tax=bioreactor metagenome TaxID=1076179 RepID=A0A645EY20_9ZZZZ